jgi:hypothetical protein
VNAPYSLNANFDVGVYNLYAVATNSLGVQIFSATNTITVTNIPFTVTLVNPSNGFSAAAPANVNLDAIVNPGSGATVASVAFYELAGGWRSTFLNPPYSTIADLSAGTYSFYAVATNSLGAICFSSTNTVTVTNVPFTVALVTPTNGFSATAPASVTLQAIVNAGSFATDTGVAFYEVTSGLVGSDVYPPYTNTINLGVGIYQFYAVATNSLNATAYSSTNTILVTNVPLSIVLNTPTNGAVYGSGAAVICQATPNAGSSGSPVDSVTFYSLSNGNPILLFTDSSPPYSNQVSGLAEGTYGFFAVVTNSDAQNAISRTNIITVSSVASGAVIRGPYMGSRGETNINIRWRTTAASLGRVRYGTTPGNLTAFADEVSSGTNHSVTLTGLTPEMKYYYSIGTTAGTLIASPNYYFTTAPRIGTVRSTRIWFLSDYGQGDSMEATVRDTYLNYITTNGRGTDVWLTGGDNDQSFSNGTDAMFQTDMFDYMTNVLQNTPIFPAPGNHDGGSSSAYWTIFDVPSQAQAGGYPSGSAHYYSLDYANIHFISMDPFNAATDVNSSMRAWLTNDLAATTQKWIIAYFHAPIYCKVFYDSDTLAQSVAMRQNFVPLLESRGVDLVISGHSHSLQRTYLLNGHYGLSSTFSETNKIDGGNGRVDGTGAYRKTNGVGTVYMVAPTGCAITRNGTTTHPACLYTINNTAGFIIIDINTNRLDFQMLTSSGSTADYFTILKDDTQSVMNPIFVSAPVLNNGVCTLAFQGTPGATYTLQYTESLNNSWQKRMNVTVPSEGIVLVQDDTTAGINRFYRLIYPPQ